MFEEGGKLAHYVGGYSDWLRRGHELAEKDDPFGLAAKERKQAHIERRKQQKPTKLSYKDQRELDSLPEEIESLEAAIADLQQVVASPEFYSQEQDAVQAKLRELADTEALLEQRIERWSELELLQEELRQ